jgi:hypothetical protein
LNQEIVEAGNIFRSSVLQKLRELAEQNPDLELDEKDLESFSLTLGEFWVQKDPSKIIDFIEARIGQVL